jgi:hypothetical protein
MTVDLFVPNDTPAGLAMMTVLERLEVRGQNVDSVGYVRLDGTNADCLPELALTPWP